MATVSKLTTKVHSWSPAGTKLGEMCWQTAKGNINWGGLEATSVGSVHNSRKGMVSSWTEKTTQYLEEEEGKVIVFFHMLNWDFFRSQWAKTLKKVHFGRTMHCLPQRIKSMFFEIFSRGGSQMDCVHATTQTHIWNWNFFHFSSRNMGVQWVYHFYVAIFN